MSAGENDRTDRGVLGGASHPPLQSADAARQGARPRRILVAVAQPEVGSALAGALANAGMSVLTASDGEQAFDIATAESPDAIVLSTELGRAPRDSVSVARWLRADPRAARIPMLHVSFGHLAGADLLAAPDDSAVDAYLTLPVDPVVLVANVRALSRIADYERERSELLMIAERARTAAVAANRAKSEFLAMMSHELRTPLNAVLGYSQLLDMGVLGPVNELQHQHLERLRTSSVHLLSLVNDVLDLARADAGRLEVVVEEGVMHDAADSAMALVRPQALARNITLANDCTRSAGGNFIGDPDRVRQILANLLSNSIKFTDPGGRVTITCGRSPAPAIEIEAAPAGEWAFVTVSDTGIGIAPSQLEHIFEAFVQGQTGHTRERGGTGLGLAISRRLARLMGGDIQIQSEYGHGSSFTLWLPAVAAARAPEPAVPGQSPAGRRQPVGAVDWGTGEHTAVPQLTKDGYNELETLGRAFSLESDNIATGYVMALRRRNIVPAGHEVADIQLRDHTPALFIEFGTTLSELGALRERAGALLRDGSELQRILAELHGVQRYRLGWSESDMTADAEVMADEVLAGFERVAPSRQSRGEGYSHARDLLRSLGLRAASNALRGFRGAAASDAAIAPRPSIAADLAGSPRLPETMPPQSPPPPAPESR